MAFTRLFSSRQVVWVQPTHPTLAYHKCRVAATVYYLGTNKLWVIPEGGSPILIEEDDLSSDPLVPPFRQLPRQTPRLRRSAFRRAFRWRRPSYRKRKGRQRVSL